MRWKWYFSNYFKKFAKIKLNINKNKANEGYNNLEVPVGCIFVNVSSENNYKILAKAHNLTNESNNVKYLTLNY